MICFEFLFVNQLEAKVARTKIFKALTIETADVLEALKVSITIIGKIKILDEEI